MSAEEKSSEFVIWLHFLNEEVKEMQKELEVIVDPYQRGELRDQLIWLRHQIRSFEETQDFIAIQESLEWVVKSFNRRLHPKTPFRHKP